MDIVKLALISIGQFMTLVFRGQLKLDHHRLGQLYQIESQGTYAIFRETHSSQNFPDSPVVLVVGFRLKLIGLNPLMHWLFQRLCILTTPFWSGFKGFRIKLWMVDPATKNYLGIYEWKGQSNAETYVGALERVLRAVSTPGSVWHQLMSDQTFEQYLLQHKG